MTRLVNPSVESAAKTEAASFNWSPYLARGETLIWQGQRVDGLTWNAGDIPKVLFMCLWLGFAIFWTVGASKAGGGFWLFGLIFIAIGVLNFYRLLKSMGFFIGDVFYALTNQRALIYQKNNLQSQPINNRLQIEIEHQGDLDSIYFGDHQYLNDYDDNSNFNMSFNFRARNSRRRFGFDRIKDGQNLYQKFLDLQSKSDPTAKELTP